MNSEQSRACDDLETDLSILFEETLPAVDDVTVARMAARAANIPASPKRLFDRWVWVAAPLAAGLALLALGIPGPAAEERPLSDAVHQTASTRTVPMRDRSAKRPGVEGLELEGDVDDLTVAIGVYLDMGLDGDTLGFDGFQGEHESIGDEEMLRLTRELLRQGS